MDDVESIISDLPILTELKEKIYNIFVNEKLSIRKKRIEIRKLTKNKSGKLEKKYVQLFINLLEYISQV